MPDDLLSENPWQALRRFTPARIALGRAGGSLPTHEVLAFQLAHAQARDAVHLAFDTPSIVAQIEAEAWPWLEVESAASDRSTYLRRPDLGRRLAQHSVERLQAYRAAHAEEGPYDLVFVLGDGLSALAVHQHALPLLRCVIPALPTWKLAPIVIASQARVALGDQIGELLNAEQVIMLIGERPGLTAADSLGLYLTYAPRVGRNDAERNCISNVRPEGLSYKRAAYKLLYLLREARRLKLSGVDLKDDSDVVLLQDEHREM